MNISIIQTMRHRKRAIYTAHVWSFIRVCVGECVVATYIVCAFFVRRFLVVFFILHKLYLLLYGLIDTAKAANAAHLNYVKLYYTT